MSNNESPLETAGRANTRKKKAESKYNANRLRELIKEGKTAQEMMEILGIGHLQILKSHVLKLCNTDQKFYEVIGLYKNNSRKAYVNQKGEIKLKNNMIDFKGLELEPDTELDVEVLPEKNQIILTIIKPNIGEKIENPNFDGDEVNNQFYDNNQQS